MATNTTKHPEGRKRNRKHGSMVAVVAAECGRSRYTVYAVLSERVKSQTIQDAIRKYQMDHRILPSDKPGPKTDVAR